MTNILRIYNRINFLKNITRSLEWELTNELHRTDRPRAVVAYMIGNNLPMQNVTFNSEQFEFAKYKEPIDGVKVYYDKVDKALDIHGLMPEEIDSVKRLMELPQVMGAWEIREY